MTIAVEEKERGRLTSWNCKMKKRDIFVNVKKNTMEIEKLKTRRKIERLDGSEQGRKTGRLFKDENIVE